MSQYLVIWRYSKEITGGRWSGVNTATEQVDAHSPEHASEVAFPSSRQGQLLVLPLSVSKQFEIQSQRKAVAL